MRDSLEHPTSTGCAEAYQPAVQPPDDNSITWPPVDPIEGLRIHLWRLCLNDAHAIGRLMTPEVSRWLSSWPANPTVEVMTERISRAESAMQEKRELHFRIEEREGNAIVGYVSVAKSAKESMVGHLSYWLGIAFQGKGYMTEAVRAAIAAGFQYLKLETIEAGAQLENVSSFAVMKRVGMTPIGERLVWVDSRKRNERCLFYSIARSAFH